MSIKFRYFLYGFLFGCCFPVFAVILEILISNLSFSIKGIILAHQHNALIYMIDTAPLFLGLFAFVGGVSKQKAVTVVEGFKSLAKELRESNQYLNERSSVLFDRLNQSNKKIEKHSNLFVEGNDELHELNANCGAKAQSMNHNSEKLIGSTVHLVELHKQLKLFNDDIHRELDEFAQLNLVLIKNFRDINSIGTEIKILALNSSIEAHKLGDQGKGFAVIARQVGVLAENVESVNKRTQQIADSISQEIKRLNCSVDEQKNELENSDKLIDEIDHATGSSKQSLLAINQSINYSLTVQERQRNEFAEIRHELLKASDEKAEILHTLKKLIVSNNELIQNISEL